jgi:hypothetical protein
MSKSRNTDDQAMAEAEMATAGAVNEKSRIDPETARLYNDYLRDWRWNMSTWRALQREYMGRSFISNSAGEGY